MECPHGAALLLRENGDGVEAMLAPTCRPDAQFERDLVAALPKLRSQLRKLCRGDRVTVDDIVQYACLRALESHVQFERGTNMLGWLFTIAQNKFFADRRRAARWELEDVDGRYSFAVSINPPQQASVEAKQALARLPAAMSHTVSLYVVGYEYSEIAQVHGVPIGTVKSRLNRARHALEAGIPAEKRA